MKAIKFLALMLVALIGMTACSDDKEYTQEWTYTGNNTVTVDKEYPPVTITCKVTQRENGTLEVEMPEYQLFNTTIGNLTIGAVTIKNIAYNAERGAYYRVYGKDGLTMQFRGKPSSFKEDSDIEVKLYDNGVTIVNNYSFPEMYEAMHLRIVSKFEVAIPE